MLGIDPATATHIFSREMLILRSLSIDYLLDNNNYAELGFDLLSYSYMVLSLCVFRLIGALWNCTNIWTFNVRKFLQSSALRLYLGTLVAKGNKAIIILIIYKP